MRRRSARVERARVAEPSGELMLAAMVDMMMNLLLFLLQLYGNSPAFLQPGEDLEFARSKSQAPVGYATNLRITRDGVSLDGARLAAFGPDGQPPAEAELQALRDRLGEARQSVMVPEGEPAELVVQADRSLAWTQLSPVLAIAGDVGFGDVRFVVASQGRGDEATPPRP